MVDITQLKRGQKVRTVFGETRTVFATQGTCMVLVEEEVNNWYHPAKLFLVGAGR